jgi:hypothetical protein
MTHLIIIMEAILHLEHTFDHNHGGDSDGVHVGSKRLEVGGEGGCVVVDAGGGAEDEGMGPRRSGFCWWWRGCVECGSMRPSWRKEAATRSI